MKTITIVYPSVSFNTLDDEPDNRILEAAYETACDFIITGDKGILALNKLDKTVIIRPAPFLSFLSA